MRPDISYATNSLSGFQENQMMEVFNAFSVIVIYLSAIDSYFSNYNKTDVITNKYIIITLWCLANIDRDINSRKYVSG